MGGLVGELILVGESVQPVGEHLLTSSKRFWPGFAQMQTKRFITVLS